MSIKTEINRIKNAVTAIVNAITAKGVTVPSGTKIDGLASLISSIPTSSGLSLNTYQVNIKSSVGNATAYYTAGDGKQYTKTITSTAQNIYVAAGTTLRVEGASGTICELSGATVGTQTNEDNVACLYLPTANLRPAQTITLVAGTVSGATLNTCTITFDCSSLTAHGSTGKDTYISYTSTDGTTINTVCLTHPDYVTIDDILCGSPITIMPVISTTYELLEYNCEVILENGYQCYVFQAPLTAGASDTIILYADD